MMLRPGLLAKTVLLLLVVFASAFLAVRTLYIPYLEGRVRQQISSVAEDCLSTTEVILRRRSQHLQNRIERQVTDLPFELVAAKPAKIRLLVSEWARGLSRSVSGNVALLTGEFRRRTEARIGERSAILAQEFRRDALKGLGLLLVAVLGLLALTLFRTVVAPLGRLLAATERVAAGDYTESVRIGGHDEVGRLGRAFDRMTAAIESSRAETEALNLSLEDKVREKTGALEDRNRELAEANDRLTRTIVELEETRDALVHSETMASVGTLAGGVAHEFNNLLGGIIGCAEDAISEEDAVEVRGSLDMILRTARRACNITENLLRFSRPSTHVVRSTDLTRLVREAVDLVRPEATKRGVRIEAEIKDLPAVLIDVGQIHQVLLNLLTNALHAMPGGGRLGVRVRAVDGQAVIAVSDTGSGVPFEERARIFEPFFTTRESGTGLGLSVSWSIVNAHGGTIDVADADRGGALFTVRLPLEE